MGRHAKNKERAVVDYRYRWPTQQTIYESRVLKGGEQKEKPKSRRVKALEQDDIDHQVELIQARKQKRPSDLSLPETSQIHKSVAADTKPGESTHPYDTGVGETTGKATKEVTEENAAKKSADQPRLKGPSRQTERATAQREATPRTIDRSRDAPSDTSGRNSPHDSTSITTPREGSGSKCLLEPQTENIILSRRRVDFRSMLGPNKRQGKPSNTSPSIATSTSTPQLPTTVARHRSWWPFKKQRSAQDQLGGHGVVERTSAVNEVEDLAMSTKPHQTRENVQNRSGSGRPRNKIMKDDYKNWIKDTWNKSGRGTGRRQRTPEQSDRIESRPPQQPSRTSREASKPSGLKQQKRYQRNLSSSQARLSMDDTSVTPGNVPVYRDPAQEDLRTETPLITAAQALRLWIGSGRSPSSKAGTQLDLASPGTVTSTSTLLIRRPSRESRISAEHRNRTWIPFWPSPNPQSDIPEHGGVDELSAQISTYPEPLPAEQDRGGSANQHFSRRGQPQGEDIRIGTHDAYLATPDDTLARAHGYAALLYIPDVIGIWQNSRLMADQYAANGYMTLAIDPFNGDALSLNRGPDHDFDGWLAHGTNGDNPHTTEAVDPIILAAIRYLREERGIRRLGAVGYCFGAKYVARHQRNGIDVGFMAHPSFVEPEELQGFRAPLSIASAPVDRLFPQEMRINSENWLNAKGDPWQINVYSHVEHGFSVRGDPTDVHQRFAKNQAFLQAINWFDYWL
ncbi:hypothetical protein Hte_002524 [Hypoxylon texense]